MPAFADVLLRETTFGVDEQVSKRDEPSMMGA
jgi:hypothetical protein